jgi:hypothetical protein
MPLLRLARRAQARVVELRASPMSTRKPRLLAVSEPTVKRECACARLMQKALS